MIYGRQKFHTCFHPIQTPNGVHWSILSRAHATTPNSWSSAYSFRHLFHRKIKLMSTFFMWQTFLVYNLPFSYTFHDLFRLFFLSFSQCDILIILLPEYTAVVSFYLFFFQRAVWIAIVIGCRRSGNTRLSESLLRKQFSWPSRRAMNTTQCISLEFCGE